MLDYFGFSTSKLFKTFSLQHIVPSFLDEFYYFYSGFSRRRCVANLQVYPCLPACLARQNRVKTRNLQNNVNLYQNIYGIKTYMQHQKMTSLVWYFHSRWENIRVRWNCLCFHFCCPQTFSRFAIELIRYQVPKSFSRAF